MQAPRPILAITVGEPAGIGPEISLRAAWQLRAEVHCVLLGDAAFLCDLAQRIDPAINLQCVSIAEARQHGMTPQDDALSVLDCPLAASVMSGQLDVRNAPAVLQTLDLALEGIQRGWWQGMVTAPLQKSVINQAGIPFSGHTEYLAQKTGTSRVVMMLACDAVGQLTAPLRVTLATTHCPLLEVSSRITRDSLREILAIIDADLRKRFGLAQPRILVTGLNPHAGESGYLGREEIDTITPAIEEARTRGVIVSGPFAADTLFQQKYLNEADCVLCMYHDQGLPVLKHASFGHGVNITLGLPVIRTSVDHGTALDVAAKGIGYADTGSMLAAIRTAAAMK